MIQAGPKRTRFRKAQKGRVRPFAYKNTFLVYGGCGIRANESCYLTHKQLEAARKAIIRRIKKNGSLLIRVFPDRPITRKPAEVRMGSGKGAVDHWAVPVSANQVLFEIRSSNKRAALDAIQSGIAKLPMRCSSITAE